MKKINVGMVLFPGFQLLDIAGARDALAEVGVLSQKDCQYDITTVGTRRNSITSSSGLEIKPDRTIFDPCPNFDTLIIPGGLGIFDIYQDETLAAWINEKYQTCRRIASICNGIFALGSAGLINHKNVTTHWMDAHRAKNEFPVAKVNSDLIHIKDGNL